jgi:predicted Zn-dependent protease
VRRATISDLIFQAARVAGVIATGGNVPVGLRYGFQGLGLFLNVNLLGKSRGFELEADQLGVQYAWKAGYDPNGFLNFFDLMASRKGYVNSLAWFRTHPPFYERMFEAKSEILYLPAKNNLIRMTSEFQNMKRELAMLGPAVEDKPKSPEAERQKDCPAPSEVLLKNQHEIDNICRIE